MSKRFNPNHAKIHRSYTVEEVACLFGVHKNTVRAWIKNGLSTNDDKRPTLILGNKLREFLQAKRTKHKRKCMPHEIYCVRCKLPQRPAGNMVEYKARTASTGCLMAICPSCNCIINKYISLVKLGELQGQLDVAVSGI